MKNIGKKRGGAGTGLAGILDALSGYVGDPGNNKPYNVSIIIILMHIFLAINIILMFVKKDMYFLLVIVLLIVITFKSGFMLLGGMLNAGIVLLNDFFVGSGDPLTSGISAVGFLAVILGMCMEIISTSLVIAGFEQSRRSFSTILGKVSYTYELLLRDFKWYFIGVSGLTLILSFLIMIMPKQDDDSIVFSNIMLSFGSLTMCVLCGYLFLSAYHFYKKARHKQVFSDPDRGLGVSGGRAPLKTQAPNIRGKNGYGFGYEDEVIQNTKPVPTQKTTPPVQECL